jgi:LysM repeat protein
MITYAVKQGDTIYKLAAQFPTSIYAILSANSGINPYNLIIGQVLNIPIENGDPVQVQQDPPAQTISSNELNLRNTLRKLWEEHVAWTRMAIESMAFSLPDLTQVSARLLRNAPDMASALRPLYGETNAARFGALIRDHLTIASQLVTAAKAGNVQAAQDAERRWYVNADQIAEFLNGINPYINKENFRNMLYNHLALTKAEAVATLNKDYAKSIDLFDQIETQALAMADTMAGAIKMQFPNVFG